MARRLKVLATWIAWFAVTTSASVASSQTLFDTGQAGTTTIGAPALFGSGSTTCGPQPACQANFQYLAARIVLPQAATISGVEIWVGQFSSGGSMNVKIREEVNGLPSTSAPPLFSPNSIYSKRYDGLPGVGFGQAQWVSFPNYAAVLAAGTYWITFEPVTGSNLNYTLPVGAPNPLTGYAYFTNGNSGYRLLPASNTLGIRVSGSYFPGVAFGTASRVSAGGSVFSCCPFSFDFVQEGTRDFTRLGTQGPALTSSYIFELGEAHIHGRGTLTENGVSAGAYAQTGSSSTGAGRGIAYRTLVNMSDQTRIFRVNATLHGAFFNSGGLARAGVYIFDTTSFSNTLLGSPKTAGHFLLDADDSFAIANSANSISLARFFAPAALLASDFETANFPTGVPTSVPMQTGLVTLPPNGTVTVLFDVAVYANPAGNVLFANTLSPAPVFLTDTSGNPVYDVVAVGPSAPAAVTPTALSVTPASSSTPVGTPRSIVATLLGAGGKPVVDANVTFTITSGPNAGATDVVATDANGDATFTYLGAALGADTISAVSGTLSGSATNTWVAGAVDHIAISPSSASIIAGASQPFTVEAFDVLSNSLGNVTDSTSFAITPEGSCTAASCTPNLAGPHTVTATYAGKTSSASLSVTSAGGGGYTFTGFYSPVDNLPVINAMKAGASVPLKFSLGGNQGLDVIASGFPISQPIACEGSAPEDQVEETVAKGSGLTYDAASDQYVYVWATQKSWANSCRQLTLKLKDGSIHSAMFHFK